MQLSSYKLSRKNYSKTYSLLIFLAIIFTSITTYAADPVSVAVVNVTFLMENAPQSEAATIKLKEKFLPQEKKLALQLTEINKLETQLKNIDDSEANIQIKKQKERNIRSRKRSRDRALQDFREELRFARDAALDIVQKIVFSSIDEVREQQKIDIILQNYLSADKRVDITNLVLDHLKKKLETASPAPEKKP